jgi:hypothetical protein
MLGRTLKSLWFILVAGTVGIAIRFGLFTETVSSDRIGISWFIMAMFVVAMLVAAFVAFAREGGFGNPLFQTNSSMKMGMLFTDLRRLVKDLANLQVFVGLYGTVVGLYLVFRGLGITEGMSSEDTTAIVVAAVPAFLLAFWTSIVGMGGGLISILTYMVIGGKSGVE